MNNEAISMHPIQVSTNTRYAHRGQAPQVVTMRAYEVYKALHGEQEGLVTGECRGGFGAGELIAYLYAYGFPRKEWRERLDEALRGLVL